eukprot:3285756-Prymnesium_polylepis.1
MVSGVSGQHDAGKRHNDSDSAAATATACGRARGAPAQRESVGEPLARALEVLHVLPAILGEGRMPYSVWDTCST